MTVVYREPAIDDAQQLARLGYDMFVETFGHLYSTENLDLFRPNSYAPELVAAQIADPAYRHLIAEVDGHIVGFCKIGFDQTLDYDAGNANIVELKQIYVFKSHHGSGIAQALTDWAVKEARLAGGDSLLLSVYNDNPRGQAFYRKNGFEHVGDTYFMVGEHRDDEYLYLKPLGTDFPSE